MSKYKYIIRDYHAIKNAEIKIEGITVLSGINGCGKSTISRWLYYLINGINDYEAFLLKDYQKKLKLTIYRMQSVCRDLAHFHSTSAEMRESTLKQINEIVDKFRNVSLDSLEQLADFQKWFSNAVSITESFLLHSLALDDNLSEARKNRIFKYLGIQSTDSDVQVLVENFVSENLMKMNSLTDELYQNMNLRSRRSFFDLISRFYRIEADVPSDIQLKEDDDDILEGMHISTLFNLHNAIYIDTPMAIGVEDADNLFWNALQTSILDDNKSCDSFSREEKKILLQIKELLGGETVLSKDNLFADKTLRYVSKDKKINILLKDAATGFKTFSYLQRLLECGKLNEETLLMIDEPEAHLHPQWIVEFARLLVLLNKKLGLKVMIATHNPDMVAAIHDIAMKEEILDNTNFYVAEECADDSHQYRYKDIGNDISEIFESFNIALENINRYGRVDLQ